MANVVALGFDIGSSTAKLVGVTADGTLAFHRIEPTEPRIEDQATRMLAEARAALGGGALPVVATGYGRKLIPGADRAVTEITCHARGVWEAMGTPGTLIDVGGQDSKVIVVGAEGRVANFAMNDKCAAGTGRFLEVTAARLRIPIDEIGAVSLSTKKSVPISSTCTVFAESEIISLLAHGEHVENILHGLHRSLVSRLVAMVRGVQPRAPYMLSGGVARNGALRTFLAESLGSEVLVPPEPQLMGAYGAALLVRPG